MNLRLRLRLSFRCARMITFKYYDMSLNVKKIRDAKKAEKPIRIDWAFCALILNG